MADDSHKTCACCKQAKPRDQFPRKASNKDGLYSYCKPCNVVKVREGNARRAGWVAHKKAYDRERTQRLKEKISAQGRERYKKNRDKIVETVKAWVKANPDKRRAISSNYKHRRRLAESGGMTTSALREWTAAQKKVCYWCGCKCPKGFHVDHYVPLSKGGAHEAGNLVIACRPCNLRKQALDPLVFAQSMGRLL